MTIPKGTDYEFTITVVEKDSFLPQDLQNMDTVNSSFKLFTLGATPCDVTVGSATMTRLPDDSSISTETTNVISVDYSVGDFVYQSTSDIYYECVADVAATKSILDTDYFTPVLYNRYDEGSDTLTRNYYVNDIVHNTVSGIWYKTIANVAYTKSLIDPTYFSSVNAYFESSNTILSNYVVNDIIKNNASGLWYRCISAANVIRLTNTGYFNETVTYTETSATTTAAYTVNSYVKDTSSGIWYRCILDSTIGTLLTNLTYFQVVTLNTESTLITTSAYAVNDLIYIPLYDTYYRCISAVGASPLLTDAAYFTAFTLNTETSNIITSDYAINDIIHNATSNVYYRCTAAATATELLTTTSNFEVITVNLETGNTITVDYSLNDYALNTATANMYRCTLGVTANELLTDLNYFGVILAADIVTYKDGKIKVVLDSVLTSSLTYLRGDAVDDYYLKPTYQGVVEILFLDGTPKRTAIIEKVYVAPTGVVCA